MGSLISYECTIFQESKIFYPLISTRTCAYQGVTNTGLSENFVYILNE